MHVHAYIDKKHLTEEKMLLEAIAGASAEEKVKGLTSSTSQTKTKHTFVRGNRNRTMQYQKCVIAISIECQAIKGRLFNRCEQILAT